MYNNHVIIDRNDGSVIRAYKTCRGHNDIVSSIKWSPNGEYIASHSEDTNICLWDKDGTLKNKLDIKRYRSVKKICWSPYSDKLAIISRRLFPSIWNIEKKSIDIRESNLEHHYGIINDLAWSNDGKVFATASDDGIIIFWDESAKLKNRTKNIKSNIIKIIWHPDKDILTSISGDNKVYLWNNKGKEIRSFHVPYNIINDIRWSPRGDQLAIISNKCELSFWDIDGELLDVTKLREENDKYTMNNLFWAPNGECLAITCMKPRIWLYNTKKQFKKLVGHDNIVCSANWSSDANLLATPSYDTRTGIWNKKGKLKMILEGHSAPVLGVSWKPDEKILATSSFDETVRLWKIK
ncbi:MAG: hypothetical protein GF329_07460 [Candidatus Lokiarchaeota archaeon]|nr:hypothetical protein [Candidatus Lokiarchaeota archaeon]